MEAPKKAAETFKAWARLMRQNLKGDLFGGVTAAIVALPLALAFGVASGLGPAGGLYGAIATGFFAAVFGGTSSQVSGPTGPMTVVMGVVVAAHANNLPEAFAIVILAGALQIAFGVARLGRYVAYTPYSVVSGFMTGIGLIIMIIQALPFLGLPAVTGGPVATIQAITFIDAGAIDFHALILAAVALATMIFWPKPFHRIAPPPLAALVIGTIASLTLLQGTPSIGEVPRSLPQLVQLSFAFGNVGIAIQAAFILALLGSIDSLLTSLVADTITRTQHNSDRELIGQGIGNIVAGLVGGLPGAGATMRTVVNVQAGGRTPVSGAFHAILLLGLALGLGPLASTVPYAVLAGILMKVGWDIIDWGYIRRLRRVPRDKAIVMLVTLILTVFVDLITAVAVGIILATFVSARWLEPEQLKGVVHSDGNDGQMFLTEDERSYLDQASGQILVTQLSGSFSYASARTLARRVGQRVLGHKVVIYDFSAIGYVDPTAALAIDDLFEQGISNGQVILVAGFHGVAKRTLEGFGALDRIPAENQFDTRRGAIQAATKLVTQPLE